MAACHAGVMNKHPDRFAELLVDVAINIAAARNIAAGAQPPAELEVPQEEAHLVLLYSRRRRGALDRAPVMR